MIDLSALDDGQRAAVVGPSGPAAGAGSGKTRILTYRVASRSRRASLAGYSPSCAAGLLRNSEPSRIARDNDRL